MGAESTSIDMSKTVRSGRRTWFEFHDSRSDPFYLHLYCCCYPDVTKAAAMRAETAQDFHARCLQRDFVGRDD